MSSAAASSSHRDDGAVELPPDVGSASEELEEVAADEDTVSLPDAVGSSDGEELLCCKLQCLKHKDIENIKLQLQAKLEDQTTKRMGKRLRCWWI